MSNSYFDLAADLGSEEEDDDYDEETGEAVDKPRKSKPKGAVEDSSEEEDDDDDEEEQRKVAEGFIADEDEEEEEEDREARRKRKRREREERENEALLDEDDLDLIGLGHDDRPEEQSKFKRLKRGHRDDRQRVEARGVEEIFEEDEEMQDDRRGVGRGLADEFDDFIEEDEFPDEEGDVRDDIEIARPARRGFVDPLKLRSGMDETAQEDMMAAFGDGNEYDWALQLQEEQDEEQDDPDKILELKDVFEPSQLVDKMLTEEDNLIRNTDIPERYQLARKAYKELDLSPEDMDKRLNEEASWMCSLMLPKRRLASDMLDAFENTVRNVLRFMNVDNLEVPFLLHNRKDYLIHEDRVPTEPDAANPDKPEFEIKATRLLQPSDLWEISELDLKYRALMEKRDALDRAYTTLQQLGVQDDLFDEMIPAAQIMEELQDVQDYLHFQYSSQLKDAQAMEIDGEGVNGTNGTNGTQKRARSARNIWDRVRSGKAYHMVKSFGISADAVAQNALKAGKKVYTEDPTERPDDMADGLVDSEQFSTGSQVLQAAKSMYAEEMAMSPRMRKLTRQTYYADGVFDCTRTEKGLKRIDEEHPFYEFKYLKSQDFGRLVREPDLFLRMLKAEEEGLIEVTLRLQNPKSFRQTLFEQIESDNVSEVADAWNSLRREVVDLALQRLSKLISKGCKESLRTECEAKIAEKCRNEYANKLDQAPYKPRGMIAGTTPRVLALSNGAGQRGDAICWAYVDENGRVLENGKFSDLRLGNAEKYLPDGKDVTPFVDLVNRRKPDVLAISGWSVEAKRLYKDLQDIAEQKDLRGTPYEDDDGEERSEKLDIVMTNDEVARLYHTSDRATAEFATLPALTRYCIGLAKYMQSPLKEYAALGKDIISISFSPHQGLVPQDKILRHLEMAMIEIVNLVGVEINEAASDTYTANLLQYVCGLGPRKAAQMLQVINRNGGEVLTRDELIGDPDRNKRPTVGPKVFENCASFVFITYDDAEPEADYLDNTRVHPEDYDTARKIVADTLDLDEEDIRAEQEENGPNALVRKLIKDDAQERLNDLLLDDYAEEIFRKFGLKKKATLELIRNDLQQPYEELRQPFYFLSTDETFTMLTGETPDSLVVDMIVPVSVRRTFSDHLDVRLDCGIDGVVLESEFPDGVGPMGAEPRSIWQPHQTIQAKLTNLDRKKFSATLTLCETELQRPYRRDFDHEPGMWDEQQEAQDRKDRDRGRDDKAGRAQRVIKHPLYRPFNSAQAQEFLGAQSRGDVVIRPSSKGLDHLAVTWKVSDNIYQHVDVLELDKENEFSVGRTLKVAGKYTYTDLDELIVLHVKAMAKKVEEMMGDERFQNGSKAQTEQWLTTYTEANPKRSMYAFCINPKFPGYFYLCFKAGAGAPLSSWPVKVIPNAFELQKNAYPDMRALKNGFKVLISRKMGANGGR
ncbi:transcription elongation factor spt6 [Myriangium duriaei CBS 260.36]|uniref:Transcription elongation factor Spt6 n=1 Tax=Myriangium duriaei CBS 260.36 TaxID=1168546 RepID=A0A9P4J181_9PEZI|nr:transcription elongation factor spt6 [Myriangium duriaei CBS 260.36]